MITNKLNRNNNISRNKLNRDKNNVLAGVNGSTVLIFLVESSMRWAAPSHAQFFNSVVASIIVGGSL